MKADRRGSLQHRKRKNKYSKCRRNRESSQARSTLPYPGNVPILPQVVAKSVLLTRKNCFPFHGNMIFLMFFQFGSRGYRNSNFIRRVKIASPFPLKTTHQPDVFRGENSEAWAFLSQSSFLSLRWRLFSM